MIFESIKKLSTITINNYLREIQLSKSQRPKYFEWNGITIKTKGKKLWKKYINPEAKNDIIRNDGNVTPQHLKEDYAIIGFKGTHIYSILKSNYEDTTISDLTDKQKAKNTKFILCIKTEDSYEKVIANPTQVGTANMQVISGQHMYSQSINEFTRNKIVNQLKESYAAKFESINPVILKIVKEEFQSNYPLFIVVEIQDTIKAWNDSTKEGYGRRWDVSNRAYPYLKTFTDYLVEEGYLEDDDRLHLIGDGNFFTPIEEHEIRKLKFHIFTDTRQLWKNVYMQETQKEKS